MKPRASTPATLSIFVRFFAAQGLSAQTFLNGRLLRVPPRLAPI
jgi:hypothetical protein